MEEPAGPIHRSMGKRALVWIWLPEADVAACPSWAGWEGLRGRLDRVASLIRYAMRAVLIEPVTWARIFVGAETE